VTEDLRVGPLRVPLSELTWRFDTPGGPGGQHANRAATRAEVRLDLAASPSLSEAERERLVARLGPVVTASSADARSQSRNRDVALDRLRSTLADAMREPRKRRPTRRTKASQERRLSDKRAQSQRKRDRRVPPREDT
jgi:ribosome-associated protein